jgi:DNA replication protein DnaC
MLGSDHTTFTDQLAERTGLWFQENLTNFVKGSNECLLLTGPAGSGKTTLSAAIVERLQRPVARQSLQTIYVSIGTVQSEATSLHVVKSILYQLLSARVGNLAL